MRAVSRQSLLTHFWTIDGHALGPGDSARAESDAGRSRTLGIFSNVLQVCFGDIEGAVRSTVISIRRSSPFVMATSGLG